MKRKYLYVPVSKAEYLHLEKFPSTGKYGNITGMRKLYWGENAYVIRSGAWAYKVDEATFKTAFYMLMKEKIFEYGGYHFFPERKLTKRENTIYAIARRQRVDINLGFCEPGHVYPSKYPYSHESFYAASSDKTCDLFRCVENQKLYIPCSYDLQEYQE